MTSIEIFSNHFENLAIVFCNRILILVQSHHGLSSQHNLFLSDMQDTPLAAPHLRGVIIMFNIFHRNERLKGMQPHRPDSAPSKRPTPPSNPQNEQLIQDLKKRNHELEEEVCALLVGKFEI